MGRFAILNRQRTQAHSMRTQNQCSVPSPIPRRQMRQQLGRQESCASPKRLLESPPIATKTNADGTVTGSLTLPRGVDPSSINFRTSTTHNGKSIDYTVSLARGRTSSEFYDKRNGKNFCKMSAVKNQDGTHSISFTLYEQATKASLYIPGHTSQSFSAESTKARERVVTTEKERAIAQGFKGTIQKDGSITGVLHLTPEQAQAHLNFTVSKKSDTSRSVITSSLSSNDLSARVEGMYDVRRTIKPDGSAILSMTLPAGHVRGEVSIGNESFTLSPEKIASDQYSPPAVYNPATERSETMPSTTTDQSKPPLAQNSNLSFLRSYAEKLSAETKSTLTPIDETALSNIDRSRSAVGLEHPAGLDASYSKIREYRFLRSNSYDDSASVLRVIQRDPPIFSRDESSYLQSIAVQTYSLNTQSDTSISFNQAVSLPEPVSVGEKTYSHGEVRSDGSVILASSANADAELAVVRPSINPDSSITWKSASVYRWTDGSIKTSKEIVSTDTASTPEEEITSPSDRLPEQETEKVENKTDLNRDYLNSWVPTRSESGVFPIPEGAQIDIASGPAGLIHPVGVHLDGQYRLLRTIEDPSQGRVPVLFKFTPSEDSDSRVEQIVALGLRGHILHDDTIRFNRTTHVSGDLPSNLGAYKFSQVRSDGSVLFSKHSDITQAGADLHVATPQFEPKGLLQGWNWISVELQQDGSLTRKRD